MCRFSMNFFLGMRFLIVFFNLQLWENRFGRSSYQKMTEEITKEGRALPWRVLFFARALCSKTQIERPHLPVKEDICFRLLRDLWIIVRWGVSQELRRKTVLCVASPTIRPFSKHSIFVDSDSSGSQEPIFKRHNLVVSCGATSAF